MLYIVHIGDYWRVNSLKNVFCILINQLKKVKKTLVSLYYLYKFENHNTNHFKNDFIGSIYASNDCSSNYLTILSFIKNF